MMKTTACVSDKKGMQAVDVSTQSSHHKAHGELLKPSPEMVFVVAELLKARNLLALSDRYINDLVRKQLPYSPSAYEFRQQKSTIITKLRSAGMHNLARFTYLRPWALLQDDEKGLYQAFLNQSKAEHTYIPGTNRKVSVFLKTDHGVDVLAPAYLDPVDEMRSHPSRLYQVASYNWSVEQGYDMLLSLLNSQLQRRVPLVKSNNLVAKNAARFYEAEVIDLAAGVTSRQMLSNFHQQAAPVRLAETPTRSAPTRQSPGVPVTRKVR